MGLEAATYIEDLVDTNPTGADDKNQGDNHLRLIKEVLQSQFPSLGAAAVNATAAELSFLSGTTSSVQTQLNTLSSALTSIGTVRGTGRIAAGVFNAGGSAKVSNVQDLGAGASIFATYRVYRVTLSTPMPAGGIASASISGYAAGAKVAFLGPVARVNDTIVDVYVTNVLSVLPTSVECTVDLTISHVPS